MVVSGWITQQGVIAPERRYEANAEPASEGPDHPQQWTRKTWGGTFSLGSLKTAEWTSGGARKSLTKEGKTSLKQVSVSMI